jgi:hypothetical protein
MTTGCFQKLLAEAETTTQTSTIPPPPMASLVACKSVHSGDSGVIDCAAMG